MYVPILKARQSELSAIAATEIKLMEYGGVIPLLEPVSGEVPSLLRSANSLARKGVPFGIIVNPLQRQARVVETAVLEAGGSGTKFNPAFQIGPGFKIQALQQFLKRNKDRAVFIVHRHQAADPAAVLHALQQHNKPALSFLWTRSAESYRDVFSVLETVILEDPFIRMETNAEYPPDEFFSDAWSTFGKKGASGFADFTIVGSAARKPGGAIPRAVAIHITYPLNGADLWIKHFVSDDTEHQGEAAKKFLQAAAKLEAFAESGAADLSFSHAVKALIGYKRRAHFPQLGTVKALGVQHHLELMCHLLPRES